MKIQQLFELFENDAFMKNPSSRRLQSFLSKRVEHFARAVVDQEGNFYVFNPYIYIHDEFKQEQGITYSRSIPLCGYSLYAYTDCLACRQQDVDDGEVHETMTDLARHTPTIVRAYGPGVTCIDIHGDP